MKKFPFFFFRRRPKTTFNYSQRNNLYIWRVVGGGSEKLSSRLLTGIVMSKSPLATVYSIRQYSINSTLILMVIKTLLITY